MVSAQKALLCCRHFVLVLGHELLGGRSELFVMFYFSFLIYFYICSALRIIFRIIIIKLNTSTTWLRTSSSFYDYSQIACWTHKQLILMAGTKSAPKTDLHSNLSRIPATWPLMHILEKKQNITFSPHFILFLETRPSVFSIVKIPAERCYELISKQKKTISESINSFLPCSFIFLFFYLKKADTPITLVTFTRILVWSPLIWFPFFNWIKIISTLNHILLKRHNWTFK